MMRRLCTLGPDHDPLWVQLCGYPVGDAATALTVSVAELVA